MLRAWPGMRLQRRLDNEQCFLGTPIEPIKPRWAEQSDHPHGNGNPAEYPHAFFLLVPFFIVFLDGFEHSLELFVLSEAGQRVPRGRSHSLRRLRATAETPR
jgi:hypothetical protein